MKKERLFRIIGEIDKGLIENLDDKRKPKQISSIKWITLAACVILAVSIGALVYQNNKISPFLETPPVITGNNSEAKLPIITIDTELGSGMGFEGYLAYDIEELVNENPWISTSQITHLPVFENTLTYNMMQNAKNPEVAAMKTLLKQTADRLGMDSENLEITYAPPTEETKNYIIERLTIDGKKVPEGYIGMYSVFMEDGNIKVDVDNGMVVTIRFDPPVLIPKKFTFTHYSTYDENYKVADYLQDQYKDLLNMKNPKINITGGDYTIYGDQKFSIEFFDNSGNDIEKIINYNFNYVTFCCDDDGKLFLSRLLKLDLSQKLGDYPIIDEEKAVELLKNKNYITTTPEEFPGEEFIRKIELIYRTGGEEQVFMPYYRIYVEMPSMKLDNGLNIYGAFYVPAVKGDYIKNMPVWSGSFN